MAGIELGTAYVTLLPSTRGFSKAVGTELQGVERQAKASGRIAGGNVGDGIAAGTKGKMGAVGGILKAGLIGAAAGAGLAVGAVFAGSIAKASDLQQSRGGVDAVFKGQADAIHKAAQGAAGGLGLTQNAYNELATTIGSGLKNKGIADFTGETQNLIGVGADLAAQFGGSTQEAVSALSSLMRGETDPIERYGVSINETAIKAELAANGQDKLTGAALDQAKTQARLRLVMKQTADAYGAFARESDTLAGKQQRASAQWENLQAKIGEKFLPVITAAMGFISDTVLPGLEKMGGWLADVGGKVSAFFGAPPDPALAKGFDGIKSALEGMWRTVEPILMEVWRVISEKWAELQPTVAAIFNNMKLAVGDAMTVIQQVIKIATAVIQYIWDRWGENITRQIGIVMDMVGGIFKGASEVLSGIWQTLAGLLTGDTTKASEGIQKVFRGLGTILGSIFGGIVATIGNVWDGIKKAISGPINWVISNAINPFIDAVNGLAKTFGLSLNLKRLPAVSSGASSATTYSTGGRTADAYWSGGYTGPGGKYQPAGIVHAGEVVWSQADVARWGGPGVVDAMRLLGAEGYANGGIVANATQGFTGYDPSFLARLRAWASATGITWYMTGNGGTRSYADQVRAWNLYQAGLGPLAARPGTSPHERGVAIDLSPRPGEIPSARALLGQFGLGLTVPGEAWHVGSLTGGGRAGGFDVSSMLAGAIAKLGKVSGGGVFGDMLNGIIGKAPGWATDWFKKSLGFDAGGWLMPGATLAVNKTGQPEAVLTGDQWDTLSRGGADLDLAFERAILRLLPVLRQAAPSRLSYREAI